MMNSRSYHSQALDKTAIGSPADYFALLKPRVMILVVFTGIAGLLVAPGSIHPFLAVVAVFCIAMASGGAAAINMWYEQDIDRLMLRTSQRPLVRGVIAPSDALAFGVVLSIFAVMLMGLATNWVAAFLLLLANLFYVFVYTIWLKRRTPQNIVVGGAAGAFPPVIGWVAVTGQIDVIPLVLFAIIFLWTPPHFWSLALYRSDDYKAAGIPMLPVLYGWRVTVWNIIFYMGVLIILTLLPWFLDFAGAFYMLTTLILGGLWVLAALPLLWDKSVRRAKNSFAISILYLFTIFAVLIIDVRLI